MNAGLTRPLELPRDHDQRVARARRSLDGLSVGDGFGDTFFVNTETIDERIRLRQAPPPIWTLTDDSMMAISIVRCLKRTGHIEQDSLAKAFAEEYLRDPRRGYGGMAQQILRSIGQGISWKAAAKSAFGGQGSCGNGGAMRSAPLGAYFADDYDRVGYEARASAEVTHAHPDGKTGAAAVALAAAWTARNVADETKPSHAIIEFVLDRLPQTETFRALQKALTVPLGFSPQSAAALLGNGSQVIASDTVPFCLWCVARHPADFTEALWTTVSGLGDRDTTCAIVGGIVAAGPGGNRIPEAWLNAREPFVL